MLSLDDQEFDEWMQTISDDDVEYAIELIQSHRLQLAEQEQDLEEQEMDLSQAQTFLAKFRL